MKRSSILATGIAALALWAGQAAHAECKLQLLSTIPVTFVNNQPMVEASINGKPAHLRLSLGRETIFWGSVLKDYGLKAVSSSAVGLAYGERATTADVTTVQVHELKAGSIVQKDKPYFIVYTLKRDDEAGYFGTPSFTNYDVELDFLHNAVRIFEPTGCKDDDVVYWGGNYSVAESKDGFYEFKLGGKTLKGELGVGNEVTFVTPKGASHAGVTPQPAGLLPMGMVMDGLIKPLDVSIANFPELAIGDETIKNVPLAVVDLFPKGNPGRLPEVILGGDFVRSHRIYMSHAQKKLYFSYVGGVMFQDIYKRLGAEPIPGPRRPPKP